MGAYSRLVKPNEPSAKKRFGQHFLRDTGVLERIVRWIEPSREDVILEIGAGDGALSVRLAPHVYRLLAIEIDSECIPHLEAALGSCNSAEIIKGDILQLKLSQFIAPHLQAGKRLRLAGNLPYNIGTAIIEKMLHQDTPVSDMAFMVQLEVAQRITAMPGTREYGYFSVECQHHSDVRLGFKVSPACFVPRPKVCSAMVSLRPKPSPLDPAIEQDFEIITKAAFSYRRKTIENSLSRHPILGKISRCLLQNAGIIGSRRAEELTVEEYEHLTKTYAELRTTIDH